MAAGKKTHLTLEMREHIEEGVRAGCSASKISRGIGVSASTVTREVRSNRCVKEKKTSRQVKLSARCAHYHDCEEVGTACAKCSTRLTRCRECRTRQCVRTCDKYLRKMCPITEKWPYVCPEKCAKRAGCGYPKCSYSAPSADASYRDRLSSARAGIDLSEGQLEKLNATVSKLIRQGHSFEAICAEQAEEVPVCARTLYNYQERGILSTANIELPRKVRLRKRAKKKAAGRDRVDRTGRTHDDFLALPLEERACVVQGDSVEGHEWNAHDALSLHFAARSFQLYLYKEHASPGAVVARLDEIERACASREAFTAIMPVVLVDRGVEFDDWEGMERSCLEPGERRCRVFYCDAMNSNQKARAERNHEQLRRILPKERTDFDALSERDLAVCTAHVNSYPIPRHAGKCAFELAEGFLPQSLLGALGIGRVPYEDVVLKPYLMAHAVRR